MNPYITALMAILSLIGISCEVIRTYSGYSILRILFYVIIFIYMICELGVH